MISKGEMELHVKCFSERMEKPGDELGAMVGGHMFGNTVFREHMHDEYYCKVFRVQWIVVGMNMPCLDRRSTTTRIASQPEDVGRVSMKSIEMEFHGRLGIRSCLSKP